MEHSIDRYGDLLGRLCRAATAAGVELDAVEMRLANCSWLTCSFDLGTGEGHAEATEVEIDLRSKASEAVTRRIVERAVASDLLARTDRTT